MKKYEFIVGIDVSKKTLDACILNTDHPSQGNFIKVANSLKGYEQLLKWVASQKFILQEGLFIMEHTGIYSLCACMFLQKSDISYTLVSGLAIKKSMGILRGKNDQKDALVIARYGLLYKDHLEITPIKDEHLIQLQVLFS